MAHIQKIGFIYLFYLLILLFSNNILAQQQTVINILTERPDFINEPYWENYYSKVKNYFTELKADNPKLNNIDISFSYDKNESYDKIKMSEYENYVKSIINQLEDGKYDMMILDDRFLFSDHAFIESKYIAEMIKEREVDRLYLDLTDKVTNNTVAYHNPKVFEDGYFNGHLYGLPFELDFDVLYYKNSPDKTIIDTSNLTWNDLLNQSNDNNNNNNNNNNNSISIALGNDDELLNFFIEYVNTFFDLTKETNIKVFYDNNSKTLFESFHNYISNISVINKSNINSDIHTTTEMAYTNFINNKSFFFKGKVSHYSSLPIQNNNSTNLMIIPILPPQNYSVLNKKYLIINPKSNIESDILIETALKLTSKEMQLKKALEIGSIPTFDLGKKLNDKDILSFCENQKMKCDLLENMKAIHIKDIFKTKNSAPFLEIRLFIPEAIKNYIIDNNLKSITNIFENADKVVMDKTGFNRISIYVFDGLMVFFLLIIFYVIYLIIKNKDHPYLKIFSPNYCILIIIGIAGSMTFPYFKVNHHTILKCKIAYVYETFCTDFTLFPMVAVTYRIYSVYSKKRLMDNGKRLNNRAKLFLIITLGFIMAYSTITAFVILTFHLQSYGTIENYRHPTCDYSEAGGTGIFEFMERRLNEIMYIAMLFMVIRTGRISKKFGEFKYVYTMIFILILEIVLSIFEPKLPKLGNFIYFLLLKLLEMVCYFFFTYYMIGNRLLYCVRHPEEKSCNSGTYYQNYINSNNTYLRKLNMQSSAWNSNNTYSTHKTTKNKFIVNDYSNYSNHLLYDNNNNIFKKYNYSNNKYSNNSANSFTCSKISNPESIASHSSKKKPNISNISNPSNMYQHDYYNTSDEPYYNSPQNSYSNSNMIFSSPGNTSPNYYYSPTSPNSSQSYLNNIKSARSPKYNY
ncbi:hypothetical protein BCR32DRAFT_269864 [Anaeromyces robustus]|uniref:G-protein coupled receptors family 3 profile domain-containing protein n=1 Tax=Anaeromyces robustus TaxID=1754192 RepID=A0A1Y1WZJ4_9FUNG|nr:hypothetical protein BCR32DRAFT_269864 [Anaeromyces robustus]|eukprot:ORX78815.1 hypothetical protein BCR32DRAFT_269864 [Anaeromyces robustus]